MGGELISQSCDRKQEGDPKRGPNIRDEGRHDSDRTGGLKVANYSPSVIGIRHRPVGYV